MAPLWARKNQRSALVDQDSLTSAFRGPRNREGESCRALRYPHCPAGFGISNRALKIEQQMDLPGNNCPHVTLFDIPPNGEIF
jgi:hypothetical protein